MAVSTGVVFPSDDDFPERLRQLVSRMLGRYPGVERSEETIGEVCQWVLIRLRKALETVPPESPLHFWQLAVQYIRQEVLDLARRSPKWIFQKHTESGNQPDFLEEWKRFTEQVEKLPEAERRHWRAARLLLARLMSKTEAERNGSANLAALLACVKSLSRQSGSNCSRWFADRKARLLACACCRLAWQPLSDECRQLVEAAEAFADGRIGDGELQEAASKLDQEVRNQQPNRGTVDRQQVKVCRKLAFSDPWQAARRVVKSLPEEKWAVAAHLVRDIFGPLPWQDRTIPPEWVAWEGGKILKLAEAIDQERQFEDLPILADALEDAGCTDNDILTHCRGSGPHVKGCWCLDLVRRVHASKVTRIITRRLIGSRSAA